jgi:ABC-type Zn uptake system ZnuABC Zn-binding protein ZnuA
LISDALSEVDVEGSQTYEVNLFQYRERLFETETYIRAKLEPIPSKNRKLVSTHDAFEYLMWPNVLQIIAVVAESPGQEPSPEDVADLARAIEEHSVPAVFREPQIDAEGRILEQAAEDAGVQVCTLYSDSLDDKVTSYIEMMRFNADEVARCLGGDSGG